MYTVALIPLPQVRDNAFLIKNMSRITRLSDDPDVCFIVSDEHPIIAKHFHRIQYRNCTVYHIGDNPIYNAGKFKTKSGYVTKFDVKDALRKAADEIIA